MYWTLGNTFASSWTLSTQATNWRKNWKKKLWPLFERRQKFANTARISTAPWKKLVFTKFCTKSSNSKKLQNRERIIQSKSFGVMWSRRRWRVKMFAKAQKLLLVSFMVNFSDSFLHISRTCTVPKRSLRLSWKHNQNTVGWFQSSFRRVLGVLMAWWCLVNFWKAKKPENHKKNRKTPPSHEHP